MIEITDLRIRDNKIIISAHVNPSQIYPTNPMEQDIHIKQILIDTAKTFASGGPSSSATVIAVPEGAQELINFEILSSNLPTGVDINSELFFVYVEAEGTPNPETPCGQDCSYTLGVTTNFSRIYNRGIAYIKQCVDSCDFPIDFADFILRYKAFILSIRACDYTQAIIFWNKFFANGSKAVTKRCRCHG